MRIPLLRYAPRGRSGAIALLAASSLAGIMSLAARHPVIDPALPGDHQFYRSMAYNLFRVTRSDLNDPSDRMRREVYGNGVVKRYLRVENGLSRQPPYVYRVLAPLTARLIGTMFLRDSAEQGFRVLNVISLSVAATMISMAVYLLSGSIAVGFLACATMLSNDWFSTFNIVNYMLVDAMAMALASTAFVSLLAGRWSLFWAVCLTGVFCKEFLLVLLPCGLAFQWLTDGEIRRRSVVLTIGVLTAYVLFRLALPVPAPAYSLRTAFNPPDRPFEVLHWIYGTFGVLAMFAIARFWRSALAIALTPFAGAAVLSAFFVTDRQRAVVYALPFVVIALFGERSETASRRLLHAAPVICAALVAVVVPHLNIASPVWLMSGLLFLAVEPAYQWSFARGVLPIGGHMRSHRVAPGDLSVTQVARR